MGPARTSAWLESRSGRIRYGQDAHRVAMARRNHLEILGSPRNQLTGAFIGGLDGGIRAPVSSRDASDPVPDSHSTFPIQKPEPPRESLGESRPG